MDASVVVILMAAAGFLFAGYLFIVMAMREGDIGFVAPFRYTALLWALILGLAFFGEFPDTATLAGAAIVVGTGIYTLYRESRPGRARHAARRPAAASRPAPGA